MKKAICQFALDDIVEAAKSYEECLDLAQKSAKSISDQRQIAELLNNLGCLAFLAGRPEKALELFNESFRSQGVALDHSLYAGARFSCHSSTVNMSVTRSNIGFLALLTRDIPKALEAFEYSVNQQQLLLRDAHRTLIASMDHLVVAQVISGNKDKAVRVSTWDLRRSCKMVAFFLTTSLSAASTPYVSHAGRRIRPGRPAVHSDERQDCHAARSQHCCIRG